MKYVVSDCFADNFCMNILQCFLIMLVKIKDLVMPTFWLALYFSLNISPDSNELHINIISRRQGWMETLGGEIKLGKRASLSVKYISFFPDLHLDF